MAFTMCARFDAYGTAREEHAFPAFFCTAADTERPNIMMQSFILLGNIKILVHYVHVKWFYKDKKY